MKAYPKGGFLYMLTLTLPLAMFLSLVLAMLQESLLVDLLGKEGSGVAEVLHFSSEDFLGLGIPSDYQDLGWGGVGGDDHGADDARQVDQQDHHHHVQEAEEAVAGQAGVCQECGEE
eukprot:TRINITY_DN23373_c0_g1_i1.p2 TRINITY_DN23373_c0_g1~~TRINITY_DN23373_c0_g1_i1.p2  ORF type:complete len:124 (+),score=49.12 TRINITY_DN23373_c0_g1_i1:24-374(+)